MDVVARRHRTTADLLVVDLPVVTAADRPRHAVAVAEKDATKTVVTSSLPKDAAEIAAEIVTVIVTGIVTGVTRGVTRTVPTGALAAIATPSAATRVARCRRL